MVRRSRSILADGWFLHDYQLATPPIHDINALAEIIHNGALTMRVEAINGRQSGQVISRIFLTDRRVMPS